MSVFSQQSEFGLLVLPDTQALLNQVTHLSLNNRLSGFLPTLMGTLASIHSLFFFFFFSLSPDQKGLKQSDDSLWPLSDSDSFCVAIESGSWFIFHY